ncbi:Hypothetical predicted protein [Cloeon dipterum]|uniref:Uncharacterized protein n=1 Tax=Cloeon dipterum TaxID=197152 RepID=A0A8S1CMJ5_9INSE|nr:Hypothetical predicted protein [Cloeon dipterum]
MRWCPACVRGADASGTDKTRIKRQIKECEKTRCRLQRDLTLVRRLHREQLAAHLQDGGRQGEALEIDLLSQIRAAEVKIVEFQRQARRLKEQPTLTTPKKGDRPLESGDVDVQARQALVMKELSTLFANNAREKTTNEKRRSNKIGAFRGYYQTFKFL